MDSPELESILTKLVASGYFAKPRTPGDVQQEILRSGHWFSEDRIAAALHEIVEQQ